VRTSTTTGRRFGRLGRGSWPLLALLVLLLALLVAALADSVGGSGQGGATGAGPVLLCGDPHGRVPSGTDGMMVCAPVDGPGDDDTTTAKDA
jgi:serine/threonine-protein kinase